jgi:hypothetical protein
MRDRIRKELAMLEEAYAKVDEMNMSVAASPPQMKMIKVAHPDHIEDGECGCPSCGEHDQSEIDMAGRDLLKAQEYAAKLTAMVQQVPGLDGWVSAKITKASDYLSSVYHFLDYELREKPQDHGHEQVAVVVQPEGENFNMGYEEV